MSRVVKSEECLKGAVHVSSKPNVTIIGFNPEKDEDVVKYISDRIRRGVNKIRIRTMVFDQFDMTKRFYDAILKEAEGRFLFERRFSDAVHTKK